MGVRPGYTLPQGLQPSRRKLSQAVINSAQMSASCYLSQTCACIEGLRQIAEGLGLPSTDDASVRIMPERLLRLSVMYHNLSPNSKKVGRIQHEQVSCIKTMPDCCLQIEA